MSNTLNWSQDIRGIEKGVKLIVADPRTIPLSELAEDNLGIALRHRPGTDVALLNGMMNVIIQESFMMNSL